MSSFKRLLTKLPVVRQLLILRGAIALVEHRQQLEAARQHVKTKSASPESAEGSKEPKQAAHL